MIAGCVVASERGPMIRQPNSPFFISSIYHSCEGKVESSVFEANSDVVGVDVERFSPTNMHPTRRHKRKRHPLVVALMLPMVLFIWVLGWCMYIAGSQAERQQRKQERKPC